MIYLSFLFIAILGITMTPIGAFLLWKRWSFLGDSLSHCALLGAAIGVMMHVPWAWSYCVIAVLVAVSLLFNLQKSEQWLSMISYGAVPLGLLCFSFLPKIYINPKDVLFGNPSHINIYDWIMLVFVIFIVFFLVKRYWETWLFLTFDRELALVEGLPVKRLEYIFVLLVALSLTIAMKFVGQLLAPGLMIMPCMAASYIVKTPEDLIKKAIFIVVISSVLSFVGVYCLALDFSPLLLSILFFMVIMARIANFRHAKRLG
jgi:zinc transport system permease protein